MLNNKPMLAKEVRDYIEAFLDTDDKEIKEKEMYTTLKNAVTCINEYLKTQLMTGRTFEIGGTYGRFNKSLNVVSLETREISRKTTKSVFFKDDIYDTRGSRCFLANDNEYTGSYGIWYQA